VLGGEKTGCPGLEKTLTEFVYPDFTAFAKNIEYRHLKAEKQAGAI
jgi:hypothetical protein